MAFFLSSLIALLFLLTSAVTSATELTPQELEAALSALRFSGYNLFANSVATSDVPPLLFSFPPKTSFTLFAPPDNYLFSLDLSSSATFYTASLHLHVSPVRRTASDLRSLPPFSRIDTLFPRRHLLAGKALVTHNGTLLGSVSLNGVPVSVPDIFVGPNIVVHGLQGILVPRPEHGFDENFADAPAPPTGSCDLCLSPGQSTPISPPVESPSNNFWPQIGSPKPDMVTPAGGPDPQTQSPAPTPEGGGFDRYSFLGFSRRFYQD